MKCVIERHCDGTSVVHLTSGDDYELISRLFAEKRDEVLGYEDSEEYTFVDGEQKKSVISRFEDDREVYSVEIAELVIG